MTQQKSPKKSETLEVRMPYPIKSAFMEKARAEGRAASEIVRQQIDLYLHEAPQPRTLLDRAVQFVKRNLKGAGLLLAGAGSAIAITLAASPANALPDLEAAFVTLDADGDGVVSLAEFIDPRGALQTDVQSALPVPGADIAIASPDGTGKAYMRYLLDTGTEDGIIPLLIVIDPPPGSASAADIANLISDAFGRLDKDGNGLLSTDEFGLS